MARVKCGNPPCLTEPNQVTIEDTYSVALENTVHMTKQFDIVGGASYNWRDLLQAQDWVNGSGFVYYQLKDSNATDWQTAAIYRLTSEETLHASVSARTRFPTIFERFSSRFGGRRPTRRWLRSGRPTTRSVGRTSLRRAARSQRQCSTAMFPT